MLNHFMRTHYVFKAPQVNLLCMQKRKTKENAKILLNIKYINYFHYFFQDANKRFLSTTSQLLLSVTKALGRMSFWIMLLTVDIRD